MDGGQEILIPVNQDSTAGGVLNLVDTSAEGWKSEDLKLIRSCAESLRSQKSLACIKAVSRLALLSGTLSSGRGLKSTSFAEVLYALNPSTRFIRASSNYVVVEVSANFRFPKLPAGYAFKGGAARIALANVIGRNTKKSSARDFDLVRFSKGETEQDQYLSARIMKEDFSHGHSVEVIKDLDQYFNSRDLTINEVLFFGKKLIFTRNAFEDFRAGIIRPSGFLKNSGSLPGNIACKMLRLAAELSASGFEFKLEDFPENPNFNRFQINLHRQRALEQGVGVEKKYQQLCERYLGIKLEFFLSTAAAKPSRQVSRSLCPGNGLLRLQRRL